MKAEYKEYVHSYIMSVSRVSIYERETVPAIRVFTYLMDSDIREFYELETYIKDLTIVENILSKFSLPDLVDALSMIDSLFYENRDKYLDLVENIVEEAIEDYASNISAYDYDSDLDIESIVENCYCFDPDGGDFDEDQAINEVEENIRDIVIDEIEEYISSLPDDVSISGSFISGIDVCVDDVNWLVSDYLEDMVDYDEDRYIEEYRTENNRTQYEDIDLIFK